MITKFQIEQDQARLMAVLEHARPCEDHCKYSKKIIKKCMECVELLGSKWDAIQDIEKMPKKKTLKK